MRTAAGSGIINRHDISQGIRPALFYAMFAVLCLTNLVTLVGLLMSPDIARLVNGQTDQIVSAYEDRVAQLRLEVDRLHSRQYAQAGDMNLQLQELAQQQEILTEQHHFVRALAEKANELGLAALPSAGTGAPTPAPFDDRPGDVAATASAVERMMADTREALAALSEAANGSTEEILQELDRVGIRPEMPSAETAAMGGPLLPAQGMPETPTDVTDANAVMAALQRFAAARMALDLAPIHRPVVAEIRLSSNFGNRRDPFTGRAAFHAGLDFPAPTGTTVLSAGAGRVSFVGQKPGYGNVIEIEHGHGLTTRYAHLSKFLAKKGQEVATGAPIAQIGSTGRSTGPHLHFEVRRNERPMDPAIFLAAGSRLGHFISQASL